MNKNLNVLLSFTVLSACGNYQHCKHPDEISEAVEQSFEHWQSEYSDMMEPIVTCKTLEEIKSVCDPTNAYKKVESCVTIRGSVAHLQRPRMYMTIGDEEKAFAYHEMQHLKRSTWIHETGCASHAPDCWEDWPNAD